MLPVISRSARFRRGRGRPLPLPVAPFPAAPLPLPWPVAGDGAGGRRATAASDSIPAHWLIGAILADGLAGGGTTPGR